MFSRQIYYQILGRVLFILWVGGAGVYLIASQLAIIFGMVFLLMSLGLIGELIRWLNTENRRLARFMDAIQEDEFTFHLPEHQGGEEQRKLYAVLNQVNRRIGEVHAKSCKQEQFYRALLDNIPGGILAWDGSGQILIISNTALTLLGYTALSHREQLEQRYPAFGLLPDVASPVVKVIDISGHMRQLSLTCSTIILQGQKATLIALQDINEALNEKETESWNRLTHILTHEIMNSIAPITSLAEMLENYFEENGRIRQREEITDETLQKTLKGLNIIRRRGNNLLRFTQSYRKLTGLPQPEIRPFALKEVTDHLQALLAQELGRQHIRFLVDVCPVDLVVRADENQLSQVILNLLQNAIQAIGQRSDGVIFFKARQAEVVTLEITDNGPGIPPDVLENIFVPFFTTKSSGSGIGLSLSRQIIRFHKGQLEVKSKLSVGTTFIITLPV